MATRNYRRTAYLEGTAAKQLERGFEAEKLPVRKKVSNTTRKNREKMFHMNLGYVAFLVIALALATFTLCGYIELQSGITNHVKQISEMEAEYNSLKMANDEEYNRITSSVDLEKIRAIAIGELGMVYAQDGQIIQIENTETDYVHQTADLK
ncbi:MAG: cell division protein FtsL [Lachnospiraceae bacterium]